MKKQLIIFTILSLLMMSMVSAVQVCFTMDEEVYDKLITAISVNHKYNPSMNLTQAQFAKKVIIKQLRNELDRYDLFLYRMSLNNAGIN